MISQLLCLNGPKTESERVGELRAYQQRLEDISKLNVEVGWRNFPILLYHGFWFPKIFLPGVISLNQNFKPAPSDLFLATFPKSGTTWLKALVFTITNRSSDRSSSSNGLNLILSRHPHECSPYLEGLNAGPHVPDMNVFPPPRQLSTHMPYSLLPESVRDDDSTCRIIYLCREPKDTLVSTFHFTNGTGSDDQNVIGPMSMADAVELFSKGRSSYGPVWEHQLEYWRESLRRPDKVLFLKYEDMKLEPEANVRKLAEFIGMPFSVEEENDGMVEEIVELCSFEKLSGLEVNKVGVMGKEIGAAVANSSFFRKGKIGDWKEHLSPEMAARVDVITRDKLQGTGLSHCPEPLAHAAQAKEI